MTLLILTQAEAFLSSKRPYVNYGELWLKRIPFGSYTKFRIQPQTTSIYNDYIDSLPLHAKGGGCVVGLTYSDNALFGKDASSAVPSGGQFAVAYRSDRFPCSRRCMSSWHCIRLRAWEMKLRQQKKVAHCNWCSNLPKASRANTRPGHVAAQRPKARGEH